jgi:pilus assembly protein Flp/PilA
MMSAPAGIVMSERGTSDPTRVLSRRSKMLKNLIKLLKDEEGATALEYGLMAAAVAGVLIVIAYFLGGQVSKSLNNVAQHM